METFLVRVWVPSEPPEPESAATLHGLAQHVRTGFTTAFADGDQLCAWLGEMATEQGGVVRLATGPATDGHEEGNP
jgi:hypothetical protein